MWVGSGPVSRMVTTSGREVSGTARTSDATAICWLERAERASFREGKRRLRRAISVKAPAAAMAATAASKAMSCFGGVGEVRLTVTPLPARPAWLIPR